MPRTGHSPGCAATLPHTWLRFEFRLSSLHLRDSGAEPALRGLPVSAHTLWLAWLGITFRLFVLAVARSRGARLGWSIAGATTTAIRRHPHPTAASWPPASR